MYSTLILLDKPRHLRYTFDAIGEIDQLIPGGFLNLFKLSSSGESGFLILRDLLFAGLKWEDKNLTIQEMGSILYYFSCNNEEELLKVWKIVFDTLDYNEWTQSINKKKEPTDNKDSQAQTPLTIKEMLDEIEKIAYGTFLLTPAELYALTPREFSIYINNFGEVENHRVGLICATIMNSQGGKNDGTAFTKWDFIGRDKKPVKIMSDEEIRNTLRGMFGG